MLEICLQNRYISGGYSGFGYLLVFKGAYLVSTWVLKPKGHAEAQTTSLIHLQTSIVDEEYNYALAA